MDQSTNKSSNIGTSFEKERIDHMLKEAGCLELHYKVENCVNSTRGDWRKCQEELKSLKSCIEEHHKRIHHVK